MAADVRRRKAAFDTIDSVFERYGFDPLETPAFERLEVFAGRLGEEASSLIFKILKRGSTKPAAKPTSSFAMTTPSRSRGSSALTAASFLHRISATPSAPSGGQTALPRAVSESSRSLLETCSIAVMFYRATLASRMLPATTGGPTDAYLNHVGFTLIALFDGFAVVAVLRAGAPAWLVAVTAVGLPVIGHFALRATRVRLVRPPDTERVGVSAS